MKPLKPLGEALTSFLNSSGLAGRVEQATVIPEWGTLVGPQIAAVTEPLLITADGTLFVAVTTSPWMAELTLMERQLLASLNRVPSRAPVAKIRYRLRGESSG